MKPRRVCTIEGCDNTQNGQGLCVGHQYRLKKYGSPHICPRGHAPPEERFFRRVEKSDGCWMWTGTKAPNGYGRFQSGGKGSPHLGAHRFSYEMHKGKIPEGMVVMHSCDTPACVNPDHLSVGTHKENTADMIQKGRKAPFVNYGERSGAAVLTEEKVRYIRSSPLRNVDLAAELGVVPSVVHAVRHRKTWRHVT